MLDNDTLQELRSAQSVFVFTGAGISRESGLPTFRDLDGEWTKFDPMTFATLEGFLSNPVLVWNNYRMRLQQIAQVEPNPGHQIMARMESHYKDFLLVTQNVDNLHERAGSKNMIKIHGDAFTIKCLDCAAKYSTEHMNLPQEFVYDTLPRCSKCSALCRPDIVWFGENLDRQQLDTAHNFAHSCDVAISIGTSGEVSGGYGFIQSVASSGKCVLEINPNETHLSPYATCVVRSPSGEALPSIWDEVLRAVEG